MPAGGRSIRIVSAAQRSVLALDVVDQPAKFGLSAQALELRIGAEERPTRKSGFDRAFEPPQRLGRITEQREDGRDVVVGMVRVAERARAIERPPDTLERLDACGLAPAFYASHECPHAMYGFFCSPSLFSTSWRRFVPSPVVITEADKRLPADRLRLRSLSRDSWIGAKRRRTFALAWTGICWPALPAKPRQSVASTLNRSRVPAGRKEFRIVVRRAVAWQNGVGIVLFVAALAVLLLLQGWKSRIPDFGVLTIIDAAQEFVDHHRLPERGAITSLDAFTPPGLTWLILPGILVTRDPRLFGYVGSMALFAGTCLGVFLIARRAFGRDAALVALVLYGFYEFDSAAGSTLFQRFPLEFFCVWVVYCTLRWVDDNDGRWLAAAILIWAAGLNVDTGLAPAILVAPAAWLIWRPAIRLAPLVLAAAAAAVIWYPYLRFERARHFVDLRSQVLRESIRQVDFAASWCDPTRVPASWLVDAARERAAEASRSTWSMRQWLSGRVRLAAGFWSANLKESRLPGSRFGIFLLVALGIAASWSSSRSRAFGICLMTMWVSLLLISSAEPSFWQLWPLQAVALSAALVAVPQQLGFPRPVRWLAAASVCVIALSNGGLLSHVDSWRRDGWAGRDAPEIAAVDAIARQMHATASGQASIGYQVQFWRFMADVNVVDPGYKVGADIDLLLKYRHHISNQDRCAEGFHPDDDYRVVEAAGAPAVNSHGRNRLSPAHEAHGAFAILWRGDRYDVLERR